MSEETPVVIDTREQTEAHTLKLITSAHPEGMVFTVQPMGAGTYLKFTDKVKTLQALNAQDMSSKQLLKIQNDLCNLLIPLGSGTKVAARLSGGHASDYAFRFRQNLLLGLV